MPGPYDYSGYSDDDRAFFRAFMTPERWSGIARYGLGEDVTPVTYEQLVSGQSVPDDKRDFMKLFLAEIMRQQEEKRAGRLAPKRPGSPGDELVTEAQGLTGGR
jgi:hypothetical protein